MIVCNLPPFIREFYNKNSRPSPVDKVRNMLAAQPDASERSAPKPIVQAIPVIPLASDSGNPRRVPQNEACPVPRQATDWGATRPNNEEFVKATLM